MIATHLMKKIFGMLAVLLALSPFAQAQVYFDSGSARPNNAPNLERGAARKNPRQLRRAIRCRDGSVTYARKNACRRHQGIR